MCESGGIPQLYGRSRVLRSAKMIQNGVLGLICILFDDFPANPITTQSRSLHNVNMLFHACHFHCPKRHTADDDVVVVVVDVAVVASFV